MTNLFDPPKRVDVDLSPYADQNAYAIGGAWEVEARRQGWNKEDIQKVIVEAQTADYDHLLDVYFAHSNDGAADNIRSRIQDCLTLPVVVYHDGKPMRCEGYYDDWHNEFGCRYETPISCDDCVFVVGPQTGDMRRGKRPFAKINLEVK